MTFYDLLWYFTIYSFLGWCFQDSDVYKWIEAVAYSLKNSKDSELEQKVDEIIN